MRPMLLAAAFALLVVSALGFAFHPPEQGAPPAAPQETPPPSAVLHGRIATAEGTPVPGVTIVLFSGLATRWEGQRTITDDDGRYRFDPLETGAHFLDRFRPGIRIEHPDFISADGQTWWDIDVPLGKTVEHDFTMVRGGNIEGTLTFGTGDWTLRDFDLRFVSADNQRTWYAKTDNKGRFRTDALFPGDYEVQWNEPKADYPLVATLHVDAGKTATFTARCHFSMKAERLDEP